MAVIEGEDVVGVTALLDCGQEAAPKKLSAKHKVNVTGLVRYAADQFLKQHSESRLELDCSRGA